MHDSLPAIQRALGWVLASLMMVVLSVVCLLQWKAIGNEQYNIAKALRIGLLQLDRKLDLANSRWNSLMEALESDRKSMKDIFESFISKAPALDSRELRAKSTQGSGAEETKEEDQDFASLPIPQGVGATSIITMEYVDILKNEVVNPEKKRLGRIEDAEAMAVLAWAQGILKTLDAEIVLETAKAMEVLRKAGAYIDYGPGEPYQTMDGVMTAAELIHGNTRMFYIYPEQYPEIYDKRTRKDIIAEACLARLLWIFSQQLNN